MISKRRILHVVQSMNRGGIETMLMNYYRNIDREKVQFDFLLYSNKKSDYEDEILKLGGRIFHVSPIGLFTVLQFCFDFYKILKENPDYKVIHSHVNTLSTIPLFIAKISRVPHRISHAHIGKADIGIKGILKRIIKLPLKRIANVYFACGKLAAQYLFGEWFEKAENCFLVKNAINLKLFEYDEQARKKLRDSLQLNDAFVFGHVGRFCDQKNQLFIIDIFAQIHKVKNDSKLVLVGDGDLRECLEEKVKKNNLENDVIFTGVVENVHEFLCAFDIYLFPSLFEGLSLSIIEAQASGLVCFCSDTIDEESKVTDKIHFLPLADGAKKWADYILAAFSRNDRKRCINEIRAAGYDIEVETKWLENYYLNLAK